MYSITIHDLTLPIKDPDEAIQITPAAEKRSLVRFGGSNRYPGVWYRERVNVSLSGQKSRRLV